MATKPLGEENRREDSKGEEKKREDDLQDLQYHWDWGNTEGIRHQKLKATASATRWSHCRTTATFRKQEVGLMHNRVEYIHRISQHNTHSDPHISRSVIRNKNSESLGGGSRLVCKDLTWFQWKFGKFSTSLLEQETSWNAPVHYTFETHLTPLSNRGVAP